MAEVRCTVLWDLAASLLLQHRRVRLVYSEKSKTRTLFSKVTPGSRCFDLYCLPIYLLTLQRLDPSIWLSKHEVFGLISPRGWILPVSKPFVAVLNLEEPRLPCISPHDSTSQVHQGLFYPQMISPSWMHKKERVWDYPKPSLVKADTLYQPEFTVSID